MRTNIHEWLNLNQTHDPEVTMFLENIDEDIILSNVTDEEYIANRECFEQKRLNHQLGMGWTLDVKLFDTDDENRVSVVTTVRKIK